MTTFFRLLDEPPESKAASLQRSVNLESGPKSPEDVRGAARFERDPSVFRAIPGSPLAYWAGDGARSCFTDQQSVADNYLATRGAYTTDDFRFYRLVWEVDSASIASAREQTNSGRRAVRLAKGGAYSTYYSDVHLAIRWQDDGAEAKAFLSAYRERKGWGNDWSAALNGHGHYFRSGLTWPRRTQRGLGMRAMPAGCIFADKGPSVFVEGDESVDLLAMLAIATSAPFRYLVELQMAFGSYEVGVIQRTPIPSIDSDSRDRLAALAKRAWSAKRRLDTVNETSHAFLLPSALAERVCGIDRSAIERELGEIQRSVDEESFRLYGLGDKDQKEITAFFLQPTSKTGEVTDDEERDDEGDEDLVPEESASTTLSWLVGLAFGRFDLRLATGDREVPPEPEPFDPLPDRSPGMRPEDGGRSEPFTDLLVDDPGHSQDLTGLVLSLAEVVNVAVPREDELRRWLARDFFPVHIKMYSKSRRKAPIYWQLATRSASYSVWAHIHAFSSDTMFRIQNEYVAPKLHLEERRLEHLRSDDNQGAATARRKLIAQQEAFVEELRHLLDEVRRAALLWNPELDDGVLINFAPLWRLVPQHKPWQKELKATWDALCAGKYDWAHLAMHLWPERVVPKCADDRSLAIAHGLEDSLWEQDRNGKWHPRKKPTRDIDALVRERTSNAVKAALHDLLNAESAAGHGVTRRRAAGSARGGR